MLRKSVPASSRVRGAAMSKHMGTDPPANAGPLGGLITGQANGFVVQGTIGILFGREQPILGLQPAPVDAKPL